MLVVLQIHFPGSNGRLCMEPRNDRDIPTILTVFLAKPAKLTVVLRQGENPCVGRLALSLDM